jgi:hypothetical protein
MTCNGFRRIALAHSLLPPATRETPLNPRDPSDETTGSADVATQQVPAGHRLEPAATAE